MPWGICLDRYGNTYVADWVNNRVQKFAPTGELLVKFEGSSAVVGSLKGPSGVAVVDGRSCAACNGIQTDPPSMSVQQ